MSQQEISPGYWWAAKNPAGKTEVVQVDADGRIWLPGCEFEESVEYWRLLRRVPDFEEKPTVVVWWEKGQFGVPTDYMAVGDVRFLFVDENRENERVYEWLTRNSAEDVARLIGDDRVASKKDPHHAAIANRILAAEEGRLPFAVVDGGKKD